MFELGTIAVLLILGFIVGGSRERKHLDELKRREGALSSIEVRMDGERIDWSRGMRTDAFLVSASVVISSDYFKDTISRLKSVFGGRLTAYESLLERARREARRALFACDVRGGGEPARTAWATGRRPAAGPRRAAASAGR